MALSDILDRIAERLSATGQTAAAASRAAGKPDAIRNMQRAVKAGDRQGVSSATIAALAPVLDTTVSWLMDGRESGSEPQQSRVQIRGLVGAGGAIDTDVSQAYGGGNVHEIVLDIPVPPGVSAWEVWGPSMLPKYDPGDVILIQRAADPIDLLLGQVALVVTEDGRRMLKRILRGSEPGLYNLESFNAPTMEDQRVVEAGAIYVVVPMNQVQRPVGTKEVARRYERKAVA